MSGEALARMRDLLRTAIDLMDHLVEEARLDISRRVDRRVNGRLYEIPKRTFEHYIAWADSDLSQPDRPKLQAIADYMNDAGLPVDRKGLEAGMYFMQGNKVAYIEGDGLWVQS